ncbi:MAG: 2-amino-4-hydroxy-6-hydroxymethyldihydropteridine diphosphokinase, partial [Bacteroidales bacterium]|nr:2-amino-4-hydroxy-6-hydroxymethyldihydropteridine diphosphokinase [Bacteroidales bacterium]
MAKALISLGANTADKTQRLADTIVAIAHIAQIEAQTPIYETPAEGSVASAPYANALVMIETHAEYE